MMKEDDIAVRLARIEERMVFVSQQVEGLAKDVKLTVPLGYSLNQHQADMRHLRSQIAQAKGAMVVISAVVAFIASVLPEFLWGGKH